LTIAPASNLHTGQGGPMRKAVTVTIVVLGLASVAAADEWKLFNSTAGRYSASFPGTPKEVTQRVDAGAGGIDATIASLEGPNAFYAISFNDYPKEVLAKQTPDQLLDKAQKGAVDKVKGKLVSQKKVAANGYPGRELEIAAPGELEIHERVYLVKSRLYQILVVSPKGKGSAEDTKKFLDSFNFQP
jgi:hypothetical protein